MSTIDNTDKEILILYDIDSNLTPKQWSPNTSKIRYLLNYKQIPFKTKWISYPDIKKTLQELGVEPNHDDPTKGPIFTLPAITYKGETIMDGNVIADYLEDLLPTPSIYPTQEHLLFSKEFINYRFDVLTKELRPCQWPFQPLFLDEKGKEYMYESRKKWRNYDLDSMRNDKESIKKGCKIIENETKSFSRFNFQLKGIDSKKFNKFNHSSKYNLYGDEICFADFVYAGLLKWIRCAMAVGMPFEFDDWTLGFIKEMEKYDI